MEPAIREALAAHPRDVHLNRTYQDVYRGDDRDLVERYRTDAAERPSDPAALYLYGRLLDKLEDSAAEKPLLAALEVDPSYPWAHFALAHFYETTSPDAAKAKTHLVAAIEQCPNSPLILRRLGDLPKDDVLRKTAAVRGQLADTRDPTLAPLLQAVWTAEFKLLPPSEHAAVRERMRSDLVWLRGPSLVEDRRALDALLEGYQLIGDDAGLDWAIAETARRFPDDVNARGAAFARFREQHPQPDECDTAARQRFYREVAETARRWVELWPREPGVRLARLQGLAGMPDAPVGDLAAAADALLAAATARPNDVPAMPVSFEAAATLLHAGRTIDRIPALIDQGKAEIRARGRDGDLASRDERERMARGLAILVNARLRLGEVESARAAFAELAEFELDESSGLAGRTLDPTEQALLRKGQALERVVAQALSSCEPPDPEAVQAVLEPLAPELAARYAAHRAAVPEPPPRDDSFQPKSLALPALELQDLSGRTWRLSDLRGKVVLIHLWWSEVGWTRAMLPWIEELSARLRGRPDFALLTFSIDDNPGKLEPIARDNGFTFPVLAARDYVKTVQAQGPSLPCTWIVDRQGVVRREDTGFSGDKERWLDAALRAIDEIGAEPAAAP